MKEANDILSITMVQYDIQWEASSENMTRIEVLLKKQTHQPDLIVLPEMFNTGFSMESRKVAVNMNSDVVHWMQKTAETYQSVIAGSVAIVDDGRFYNRFLAVYPSGEIVWYDKRHLFRMSGEEKSYSAGNNQRVINIKGWRCALFVCYDLRFPVWLRNCNSYDLLLFAANWPVSRIEAWKTLLKARALENQCYVAGVNRVGQSGDGAVYNGCSVLHDYKGNTVGSLSEYEEGLIEVQLSMSKLNDFREKFPVWMDADEWKIMN
ncbi:MAG: amidohydrolase [Cytophagaceae bacterium]|jgi:predicted amidohydrolase|nr:amidohydrolase [Cytophagaceae bacterium]